MKPCELKAGDVVQLAPGPDKMFGGCFMLVTEPRPWGAQGFVAVSFGRGKAPGRGYYRANWEEMELVGGATWAPEGD